MDNPAAYGIADPLRFWAYAVLALPLAAFLVNGLWLGRRNGSAAGRLAAALTGLGFAAALALAQGWGGGAMTAFEHVWMPFSGRLAGGFCFYLDPLSVMMTVLVSGISFLVHVYSLWYMREDRSRGRFFALLPFFTFTMLGLVSARDVVQTFFFWELVGAASYLLIGFWYEKPSAVAASKKAFVITRLADAFFLAGLMLAGLNAQGFDFGALNAPAAIAALDRPVSAGGFTFNLLFASCLCLFAGAWGKSAMFPLHVWLPDAMEGPTPVSALIHSATMVVAGVYLTARFSPLFSACEPMLRTVEGVGMVTALFSAVVACAQTDLKRILAFSTLSQLGLMMCAQGFGAGAAGVSGYSASLFHVFTHAFFKCLLFLAAGVVIHAAHGQDLRGLGGLRSRLPWTYAVSWIASLAIAGVWPFAGFFSKDEILLAALANGRYAAFAAVWITGGITAFYTFRCFFLIFHGPRAAAEAGKSGEPVLALIPMAALAALSVLAGSAKAWFLAQLRPAAAIAGSAHAGHGFAWLPYAALGMAALGMAAAYAFYGRKRTVPGESPSSPLWHRLAARKFYLDEAWTFLGRRVGVDGVSRASAWAERRLVNGAFDFLSLCLRFGALLVTIAQNGRLQFYSGLGLAGFCLLYLAGRGSP